MAGARQTMGAFGSPGRRWPSRVPLAPPPTATRSV
jgi:hypothetical protein